MPTTIQLKDDVREQLRDYQLPDESANDAVERMIAESEPPQFGVSEDRVREIVREEVRVEALE